MPLSGIWQFAYPTVDEMQLNEAGAIICCFFGVFTRSDNCGPANCPPHLAALKEQAVGGNRYLTRTAAFAYGELSAAMRHAIDALEIVRHLHEKSGVGSRHPFARVEEDERGPAENARLLREGRKGLVQSGGSELQASRERLAFVHVPPDVQPGILRGLPHIT